jgi:hypothetical protein
MNNNTFEFYLENAIKSVLENKNIDFGDNKSLIKSELKRHTQLMFYTNIDRLINKLIP